MTKEKNQNPGGTTTESTTRDLSSWAAELQSRIGEQTHDFDDHYRFDPAFISFSDSNPRHFAIGFDEVCMHAVRPHPRWSAHRNGLDIIETYRKQFYEFKRDLREAFQVEISQVRAIAKLRSAKYSEEVDRQAASCVFRPHKRLEYLRCVKIGCSSMGDRQGVLEASRKERDFLHQLLKREQALAGRRKRDGEVRTLKRLKSEEKKIEARYGYRLHRATMSFHKLLHETLHSR